MTRELFTLILTVHQAYLASVELYTYTLKVKYQFVTRTSENSTLLIMDITCVWGVLEDFFMENPLNLTSFCCFYEARFPVVDVFT